MKAYSKFQLQEANALIKEANDQREHAEKMLHEAKGKVMLTGQGNSHKRQGNFYKKQVNAQKGKVQPTSDS